MTHRGSGTEKRRRQEGEEKEEKVGGGDGGKGGGSITVALVSECEATLPSTAADTADGHVSKRVVMIPLGEPSRDVPLALGEPPRDVPLPLGESPRDVPPPMDPLGEVHPSW